MSLIEQLIAQEYQIACMLEAELRDQAHWAAPSWIYPIIADVKESEQRMRDGEKVSLMFAADPRFPSFRLHMRPRKDTDVGLKRKTG